MLRYRCASRVAAKACTAAALAAQEPGTIYFQQLVRAALSDFAESE